MHMNEHVGHMTELPAAGWYRDPKGRDERWWDGESWTDHRREGETVTAQAPGNDVANRIVGVLAEQPRQFWMMGLAILGIIVGSFGPWVTNALVSQSGMDVDGIWFILGALSALGSLWAFAKTRARGALVWPLLVGLFVAGDSIRVLSEISDNDTAQLLGRTIDIAEPGWGIYLTLGAGVAMVVLSAVLAFRRRDPQTVDLHEERVTTVEVA